MNYKNFMNAAYAPAQTVSLHESIRMLEEAGNRVVRHGIRKNLVTFPSEVPVFKKTTRPDLQAKFAVLYFIRGWSASQIGERYGLGRQRVTQIVTKWRLRAVRQGYIQLIDEATVIPVSFMHELAQDTESAVAPSHAAGTEDSKVLDPNYITKALRQLNSDPGAKILPPSMGHVPSMMLG